MLSLGVLAVTVGAAEGRPMAVSTQSKEGKWVAPITPPWLKAGVSREAYEDFQEFWEDFEARPHRGDFAIPRIIVWLNGAPGAGKGTCSHHVADIYGIGTEPLVTSDLLKAPEFVKLKDSGKLSPNRAVTALVFNAILSRHYADGVIVDGYPRTSVQAECVQLLRDKILSLKQQCDFQVVIFEVSEEVSVERQLGRGVQAKRHNENVRKTGEGTLIEVRKTDESPEAARDRFRTFQEQTADALNVLQEKFPCHRVNAEGSFEQVRHQIYEALQAKEKARGKSRR
ncbi:MAG: nucleoside monophosphate kinase [Puniceicoccales bacterium]|nr:nucleoside monophosphate kinase [Puniceicoccales bacterium]